MTRRNLRRSAMWAVAVAALLSVSDGGRAWAQGTGDWSFLVTPQVWLSHIESNGFVAPTTPITLGIFDTRTALTSKSEPNSDIYPQWGLQLAAQNGPWILAGAAQYVSFTTNNELSPTRTIAILSAGPFPIGPNENLAYVTNFQAGSLLAREAVNTDRIDVDLAVSHYFPDVIKDWLDMSLGIGGKLIYASASRRLEENAPVPLRLCDNTFNCSQPVSGAPFDIPDSLPASPGYVVCAADDCSDLQNKEKVKSESYLYGMTVPVGFVLHLSQDKKWLLPVNASFFLGAETRDDKDVVYAVQPNAAAPFGFTVKRLDGTTFAYGVTADATVRYIFDVGISVYAGMRVQWFEGHEKFLAWGPVVGMSARFGGR